MESVADYTTLLSEQGISVFNQILGEKQQKSEIMLFFIYSDYIFDGKNISLIVNL